MDPLEPVNSAFTPDELAANARRTELALAEMFGTSEEIAVAKQRADAANAKIGYVAPPMPEAKPGPAPF